MPMRQPPLGPLLLLLLGVGLSGPGMAPARADPNFTPAEQQFLNDLSRYVHPSVAPARLVELGNLTCTVRRNGGSTDDAKRAVSQSLDRQGVVSSNADIGTLVHEAVDYVCPQVGYP
jgi:hypothetical protein